MMHDSFLPVPDSFLPDDVIRRARQNLYLEIRHAPEDPRHSDYAIAGMTPDAATLATAKPAAVLIPLIAHATGMTVLLTHRTAGMRQHSGQIAFPGGKVDEDDSGPLAAALREAEEEIGLSPLQIEPLGYLAPYFSTTGYRITPVVALVRPGTMLRLNAVEVASSFEVPLAFLMNPANHQTHEREWRGEMRRYFAMPYEDHYIWGVTAGILHMLWQKLYAPRDQ
jgi:8-oxo-dGTP pyrophosphatase MutT (NUDIX family)